MNIATKARLIENMNEAQIDEEIAKEKERIKRAETIMAKNDISNTPENKAMREAFPGGVGGDGWSNARRRAFNRRIGADARKAGDYVKALQDKESAQIRLKSLEEVKKEIFGTGKTKSQIKEEARRTIVKSTPKTMKWETTQKESYTNGIYTPKTIKCGLFTISGSSGLYTLYENGRFICRVSKLGDAKAIAEKKRGEALA